METKCVFKFVAGALFVATGTASTLALAEELCYQTGFERPAFTPGQLDGQYEWHDPSRTTLVLPAAPLDGEQSLRVFGNKLNPLGPGIVGTRVARLFFYDATDQTVEISVDARLDGPSTRTGTDSEPGDDLISANLDLLLADAQMQPVFLASLLLSSSGDVWIHDYAGNYVGNVPVDLAVDHRLGARIDFSSRTIQFYVDDNLIYFYVDDILVTALSFDDFTTTNTFGVGALSMFAIADKKLLNPSRYKAYFDDYCVATEGCATACVPSMD